LWGNGNQGRANNGATRPLPPGVGRNDLRPKRVNTPWNGKKGGFGGREKYRGAVAAGGLKKRKTAEVRSVSGQTVAAPKIGTRCRDPRKASERGK